MKKVSYKMKYCLIIIAIFAFFCNVAQVCAVLNCRVLQISVDGGNVISYIECDSQIDTVDGQIAQYPCKNIVVSASENISIHTIILLDNSLSISENNRENIKKILRQYVQEMPEREVVSLAIFGENIQFLTEKSKNVDDILQSIDTIEFQNQDTYLTDYLFQILEKYEDDPEYTRYIVISDGVDNKALGITKEELIFKLKEVPRPIYTIGHIYGYNSDELKNMFALSRTTYGKKILIEDFEDISLIVEEIHDFSNVYAIRMEIPQAVMDGARKNILLNVSTDEGDIEVRGEVSMPFTLVGEEAEITPEPMTKPTLEPTPEQTLEPVPEPTIADQELPEENKYGIGLEKIAGMAVLILSVIFLIFYQKKKKAKAIVIKKEIEVPVKPVIEPAIPEETENSTEVLDGRYLLVLRDIENPERIFRYPLDQHVIVGRNIDKVQIAIDYNLTVSGQHCEFYIRNNHFYLRDMNSANHTYLDGKITDREMEISTGNIVRIGEVEFSIEILSI